MGDTGAMVIGMFLGVLVIHFMNTNYNLPDGHTMKFSASIATAACFIIIPLCDTPRIIILRFLRGQSPFRPDKSHIHHAIMRLGMTHAQTAIILGSVNLFFLLIAWTFRGVGDAWMLPAIVMLVVMLSIILDRLILRKFSSKA